MKIEFDLDDKILSFLRDKDVVSSFCEPDDDNKFVLLYLLNKALFDGFLEKVLKDKKNDSFYNSRS